MDNYRIDDLEYKVRELEHKVDSLEQTIGEAWRIIDELYAKTKVNSSNLDKNIENIVKHVY